MPVQSRASSVFNHSPHRAAVLDEADQLVAGCSRGLLPTAAVSSGTAAAFCLLCRHIRCRLPVAWCTVKGSGCCVSPGAGTRLAEVARDVQLEAEAHPTGDLEEVAALVLRQNISQSHVARHQHSRDRVMPASYYQLVIVAPAAAAPNN